MLALQLPAPHHRWTAADVVRVRERYGADFLAFRQAVEEAAAELGASAAEIRQPEPLAAYLDHELRTRFAQPLDDLRRQLRGLGLDAATLTLNAKFEVPAVIAMAVAGRCSRRPRPATCCTPASWPVRRPRWCGRG